VCNKGFSKALKFFLQTFFPFVIAFFPLPKFSHILSLVISFSLSPYSLSPCAIDLSPLPSFSLFLAIALSFSLGQGSFSIHVSSIAPLYHRSLPFGIIPSSFFSFSMALSPLPLHCVFPSTIIFSSLPLFFSLC
jgi:hypothetical protein